jgi:hypothetical protein
VQVVRQAKQEQEAALVVPPGKVVQQRAPQVIAPGRAAQERRAEPADQAAKALEALAGVA